MSKEKVVPILQWGDKERLLKLNDLCFYRG